MNEIVFRKCTTKREQFFEVFDDEQRLIAHVESIRRNNKLEWCLFLICGYGLSYYQLKEIMEQIEILEQLEYIRGS